MHVAILIVSYRNPDDVVRCLSALGQSTHTDFEIFICENGGPDAFRALDARMTPTLPTGQPVRWREAAGNLGFAGGVNSGLQACPSAGAWWVLNPDTEAEPDALEHMVRRLETSNYDAVGCTLYKPDGFVQSHGGRWWPWFARSDSLGHGDSVRAVVSGDDVERRQNYLNGASMLIGRSFLTSVGPMREDYFLYCEEVEWFLRGAKTSMRLGFEPLARVLHAQGTTTGAGEQVRARPRLPIFLDERNRMLLTRDCFPSRLPIAALAALALMFSKYGRRRAWRQLSYGLAGWAAGLRNERGPVRP